jgi:hypothetical protein
MKKLILPLILIFLIVISIFKIREWRKFSPPNEYDYVVLSDKIDANYYDAKIVSEYYETAYKIGNFARQAWSNYDIDVKFPDQNNPQSVATGQNYQQMLARTKQIETKLVESKRLKSLGFGNQDVKFMEENGISEKYYAAYKILKGRNLKITDENEAVWEVQKLLIAKNFQIKLDGVFDEETQKAVKDLQTQNKIYPSGIVDEALMRVLMR